MASLLSDLNVLSESHNSKTVDLKALSTQKFNIQIANNDLINQFVVYRFN